MSAEASTLVLGMNPQWFAGGLFALTYVLIMTERVNRAIIALLAAGIMIFSGILTTSFFNEPWFRTRNSQARDWLAKLMSITDAG